MNYYQDTDSILFVDAVSLYPDVLKKEAHKMAMNASYGKSDLKPVKK